MDKRDLGRLFKRILRNIQVEMSDEFDKNFERQAFFNEAWERRHSPLRQGRAILVGTGQLRRSIHSKTTENSVTFYSDLPYAAIHNEGGEIVVTAKMKRYFWHKYMTAAGVLQWARRKDGTQRRDKRTVRISTEAEFWKFMALKKVGTPIKMPKRQFLGTSPEVEKAVMEIVEANINEFFNSNDIKIDTK